MPSSKKESSWLRCPRSRRAPSISVEATSSTSVSASQPAQRSPGGASRRTGCASATSSRINASFVIASARQQFAQDVIAAVRFHFAGLFRAAGALGDLPDGPSLELQQLDHL